LLPKSWSHLRDKKEEAMARTIIYPARPGGTLQAEGNPPDPYADKIVKYVPAEVLSFFLPAVTLANGRRTYLITCLVVGAIGTLVYLWLRKTSPSPRWYFYILGMISFVAWAVGTSAPTADLIGIAPDAGTFWLAVAVFLIPGIDEALTKAKF
jgi:hypothetical protein